MIWVLMHLTLSCRYLRLYSFFFSFFFFFLFSLDTFNSFILKLCGSAGKESTCNVGDLGSTPGLGRSPGEGKDYPLQYSGLENSMGCIVHRVANSQTQLSDFHLLLRLDTFSSFILRVTDPLFLPAQICCSTPVVNYFKSLLNLLQYCFFFLAARYVKS